MLKQKETMAAKGAPAKYRTEQKAPISQKNISPRAKFARVCYAMVLPLTLLFLEIVAHIDLFGFTFGWETLFLPAISLGVGFLLALISFFLKPKAARIFTLLMQAVFGFIFSFYLVYYSIFHTFFSWQIVGMATDVTQFWREALFFILRSFYLILLGFLPLLLFAVFGRKRKNLRFGRPWRVLAATVAIFWGLVLTLVLAFSPTQRNVLVYLHGDFPAAYRNFGVLASSAVDFSQGIFGAPEEEFFLPTEPEWQPPTPGTTEPDAGETQEEPDYGYNVSNIDFAALAAAEPNAEIRKMHEYVASLQPTRKTEYTGMFAGKNLIVITLEGFSDKVISPTVTPTLYRMATQGFCFSNFYHTLWGGSTATGEYSVMTGNFHSSANCLKMSADTLQYYAFGNLFGRAGYDTYAYHDHTYTYYGRDLSHPNFGYPNYKGIGNGLVLPHNSWPNSDYEMALVTGPEYINSDSEKPFQAYYMSVSGHANYTWMGNSMASRHRNDIGGYSYYNEDVKAYLACQYEVELMLTELVRQLEEAGKLEDTVFAMCCDHYPYALTDSQLSELYGLPQAGIRNNFDLYRNGFILWCADMEEPITVETPCSSYDILPTLANLFGLEYDSRLITGHDVLALEDNLVIINNDNGSWNWVSAQGSYDRTAGVFTPNADCTLSEEEIELYVKMNNTRVSAMRTYSFAVLERDYYRYVFKTPAR